MFRKIAITLTLASISLPVSGLDVNSAYEQAKRGSENLCQGVWLGAKTKEKAIEYSAFETEEEISNHALVMLIKEKYGDDHVIVKAYFQGFGDGIDACFKEYEALPDK
jgi:hypothetical protein